jgi:hypothetical protein
MRKSVLLVSLVLLVIATPIAIVSALQVLATITSSINVTIAGPLQVTSVSLAGNTCTVSANSWSCSANVAQGNYLWINATVLNPSNTNSQSAYTSSSCNGSCPSGVTLTDTYTNTNPLTVPPSGTGYLTVKISTSTGTPTGTFQVNTTVNE